MLLESGGRAIRNRTSCYQIRHSDPDSREIRSLQADGDHAQRVNIAGRNRMLCTRIVKLSLFSGWGVLPEVIERLFSESVSEFQRNLDFMRAASRGSPEIRAQLGVDAEQWHLFLEVFGAGKPSLHTPAQALEIFRAGEALHRHADATVKLFELVAG